VPAAFRAPGRCDVFYVGQTHFAKAVFAGAGPAAYVADRRQHEIEEGLEKQF